MNRVGKQSGSQCPLGIQIGLFIKSLISVREDEIVLWGSCLNV